MNTITTTGEFTRKVTNREPKLTQIRAREIMGRNFFGAEEASKHFGVKPSAQELAYLSDIPFSEDTLTACRNSHVLIAVFPLSIRKIRHKVAPEVFYRDPHYPQEEEWDKGQAFAMNRGELGWHLVHKTAVSYSAYETWCEQQKLLNIHEKTPTARVLVYTMAAQRLSAGELLFIYLGSDSVRCADLLSSGNHVVVSGYRRLVSCYRASVRSL